MKMDQESPINKQVISKTELIKTLEGLNLPDDIIVASQSVIKVDTVKKVLKDLFPNREFVVTGVKASSDKDGEPIEQPVDDETKECAERRLTSAEELASGIKKPKAFVVIENGIFKKGKASDSREIVEDKCVVLIKLPDGKTIDATSPRGVIFPAGTVEATLAKEGGFRDHTVGSTIAEMFAEKGIEINKQDPHSALTNDEFTREDQMISAIEEALKKVAGN